MLKRFAFLLITLSIMTLPACVSESSSDDEVSIVDINRQAEIVEKLNLPPEPDPVENNKTQNGIDVNNNEIRDDWERAIAFEMYPDLTRINLNNELAKNYTRLNNAYEEGDTEKYRPLVSHMKTIISCAGGFGDSDVDDMGEDTFERKKYILKRDAAIVDVIGNGFHGLSSSEKKDICEQFKVQ